MDWVSKLSECSLAVVWEQLKQDITADVDERRAQLLAKKAEYGFSVFPKEQSVAVVLQGSGVRKRTINFVLTDHCISVRDGDGKTIFDATLTLNDAGECRFKIDGQEKEFWKMRQLALEDLLFGPAWPRN